MIRSDKLNKLLSTLILSTTLLAACSTSETVEEVDTNESYSKTLVEDTNNNPEEKKVDTKSSEKKNQADYFYYQSDDMVNDTEKISGLLEAEENVAKTKKIAGLYKSSIDGEFENIDDTVNYKADVLLDIKDDGTFTTYEFRYKNVEWDAENEVLLSESGEPYDPEVRYDYHYFDEDDNLKNIDGKVVDIRRDLAINSGYVVNEEENIKFHRMERKGTRLTMNQNGELIINSVATEGYHYDVEIGGRAYYFDIDTNQMDGIEYGNPQMFTLDLFEKTDLENVPFANIVGEDGHLLSVYQLQTQVNDDLIERRVTDFELRGEEGQQNTSSKKTFYYYNLNELFQSVKVNELYGIEEIITDKEELSELSAHVKDTSEYFEPEIAFETSGSYRYAPHGNRKLEYDWQDGLWEYD